jgi:protein-S-isoprenylcysteine O-methyltransferase Ste14
MPLLVESSNSAEALLVIAGLLVGVGEVAATYVGARAGAETGHGRLATLRQSLETGLLARNTGDAPTADRGTKWLLLGGMLGGLAIAWLIAARLPTLRAGANSWATLVVGMLVLVAGVGLRAWGVATLGRFFQREVVVERGQTLITTGPYASIRHPAYTGNLLTIFGFGLMLGSWVGAAAGVLVAFGALLPRLRVEERALSDAFGSDYRAYAAATARLAPGVW